MKSSEATVSSEANYVAHGANHGTTDQNHNIGSATTAATGSMINDVSTVTIYGEILNDLCRRIEHASYYSGSSATLFLRGALGKYEEEGGLFPGKCAFLPRGLTDVLLERLLLGDECDNPSTQRNEDDGTKESNKRISDGSFDDTGSEHKNLLVVAKALACDHSKYLPAIAASLSDLLSSTSLTLSPTKTTTKKIVGLTIPKEFLQVWVSAIVDHSTPQILHNQLLDDLFGAFDQQLNLSASEDLLAVPEQALRFAIEGDSWNSNCRTKALSPPETEASLRRAALVVRFLSRVSDCELLDSETKLNIAESSGAIEWFLKVLGGEGCPTRYQRKLRETRSGLLGLLVDECKVATDAEAASVGWLFSPKLEKPVLLFFENAIRQLVEDWNEHLASPHRATTSNQPGIANASSSFQSRTNRDLLTGKNRGALFCATLYVRYLARLPRASRRSSCDSATDASSNCDHDARDLLARMLGKEGSSLQRLRLVRLLIDEFGSRNACEIDTQTRDPADNTSWEEWLSSPEIMVPVLELCWNEPFLGSSDAAIRYLGVYGDPSWKESFHRKPMPREAPASIAFPSSPAIGFAQAPSAQTTAHVPTVLAPGWLSETMGRLRQIPVPRAVTAGRESFLQVVRNTVVDRFGRKLQEDHSSVFDGSHRTKSTESRQHDHYSLFPGG
mmetsp:Transcript_20071/g.47057  ORF Transcript_20071/g.47057 Transcript_20071/m.47057 type:complete len:673 (-) Transcript_20071:4491-6509(-)